MLRLTLLFVILIVYGSLYPFAQWGPAGAPLFSFLAHWPSRIPGADLVQNVLAYAPFGLFLTLACLRRGARLGWPLLARVSAAGVALSLTMESLQQFEPSRTASSADIAMNLLGTAAGALLALLFAAPRPGVALLPLLPHRRLHAWRARHFHAGTLPNIGLAAVALWVLTQTSPLVPSIDPAYLHYKLEFLGWQLVHAPHLRWSPMLATCAQVAALGFVMRTLAPAAWPGPRRAGAPAPGDLLFAALVAAVFVAKLLVYGRFLTIADLAGAACALAVLALQRQVRARRAAAYAAVLLLAGFIIGEMAPGYGTYLQNFNWVPLQGQLRSLAGLENILELFWPFFTLAYCARWLTPPERRAQVRWLGGLLVLALVFQLEWMQQSLPGRYGDITQVLLAVCGWLLPFSFSSGDFRRPASVSQSTGDALSARSSISVS